MTGRVADAVARALRAAGVRHAFGMPGGEVVALLDALGHAGIRFTLARHETPAAIMAAGCAAASGAPGLLVTTLGPGLANAVNGVADAAQERVPLLVVSGVADRSIRGRFTHQVLDHAALLRPAVKGSFEVEPHGAVATVRRALRLALAPPMGPVHLDLSPADAAAPYAGPPEGAPDAPPVPAPVDPRGAPVAALRRRLERAERPILLAGLEAVRSGAAAAVAALAHRGVPVVTTYKAKGLLDEAHPLALGGAGLSPLADGVLLPLFRAADLVLLAGYDPIEMRAGWMDPFGEPSRVVELCAHPADHGMHAAGEVLLGPVGPVLDAAVSGLPPLAPPRALWPDGEPARARDALARAFAPDGAWGPHAAFDALAAALPGDALVAVDSGAHRILLSQAWRCRRPLSLLQSAGFCTMGSALPLAIGAALARPGRRVAAVLGDGGMEMTAGELATARDAGVDLLVLVVQDRSLGLIELKQAQAGLPRAGVALGPTRFDLLARAFGAWGRHVEGTDALRGALAEALARPNVSLVSCGVEVSGYAGRI